MENEPIVVQVFWWMYLAIVSILALALRHPVMALIVFVTVCLLCPFILAGFGVLLANISKGIWLILANISKRK